MDGDLHAPNSQLLRAEMSKLQVSVSPNAKILTTSSQMGPPHLRAGGKYFCIASTKIFPGSFSIHSVFPFSAFSHQP
jgi:hypothetical protein